MVHASLEQLLDEHREINDRAIDILRLVEQPALDIPALDAALAGLAALVAYHSGHEDLLIYDVAAHLRSIGQHRHEQSMAQELADLKESWTTYLANWGQGRIAADPARFRTESVALLTRIQDRVRIESELLYFTALRYGLIALRDQDDADPISVEQTR